MHKIIAGLILLTLACESNRPMSSPAPRDRDARITAADMFTQRYSTSRLSKWNVRASAAGNDCSVLLVDTSVVLEDSIVEAIHYGTGAYEVYRGGVRDFYRERSFRGVAYRDPTNRVWTYGSASDSEDLGACH